jgi:hypothetical protein
MNKSSILHRSVQGVFRFVLFAHCFTTVHEWGSVEMYTCSNTALGRKRKK